MDELGCHELITARLAFSIYHERLLVPLKCCSHPAAVESGEKIEKWLEDALAGSILQCLCPFFFHFCDLFTKPNDFPIHMLQRLVLPVNCRP